MSGEKYNVHVAWDSRRKPRSFNNFRLFFRAMYGNSFFLPERAQAARQIFPSWKEGRLSRLWQSVRDSHGKPARFF